MAHLRFAYDALSADKVIGSGASSHVFAVNERLAVKCPTMVHNEEGRFERMNKENWEAFKREKDFCRKLMRHTHPYIIQYVYITEDGIFMPRLSRTMRARLSSDNELPYLPTQCQWILQLAEALKWLETLEFAHGDLRPANILLDHHETLKLCDFDASVEIGRQLLVATDPFCKLEANYDLPIASSTTEQFALAGTIYNIRYGQEPLHDCDPPSRVIEMMGGRVPETSDDQTFGDLIQDLWQGRFAGMAAACAALRSRAHSRCAPSACVNLSPSRAGQTSSEVEIRLSEELLADVNAFLSGNM